MGSRAVTGLINARNLEARVPGPGPSHRATSKPMTAPASAEPATQPMVIGRSISDAMYSPKTLMTIAPAMGACHEGNPGRAYSPDSEVCKVIGQRSNKYWSRPPALSDFRRRRISNYGSQSLTVHSLPDQVFAGNRCFPGGGLSRRPSFGRRDNDETSDARRLVARRNPLMRVHRTVTLGCGRRGINQPA